MVEFTEREFKYLKCLGLDRVEKIIKRVSTIRKLKTFKNKTELMNSSFTDLLIELNQLDTEYKKITTLLKLDKLASISVLTIDEQKAINDFYEKRIKEEVA